MASVMNGVNEQLNGDDSFEPEDYASFEESEASLDQEPSPEPEAPEEGEGDGELPQCKIKRNYACPECPYFTQNPRIFLYHLKNFHQHKIRIYECPHCLYASKHSQKLQRHLQMVHVDSEKKKDSSKTLSEEKEEEEDLKYESDCFNTPLSSAEGEDKMFKCAMCPFNSRSESLIARHEKVVHLKKRFFRCTKCNYVTHMKARFTKHVKYHSMPMIKCELCDFKTPYKWNLDRHMKNHSSDGSFKCSLCSFTADIKQSLTVHEMNHHVPPVGQGAPSRRRNRVGASDSQQAEEERHEQSQDHERAEAELLRLEREGEEHQVQMQAFTDLSMLNEIEVTKKPDNPPPLKKQNMKKPKTMAQFSSRELTMKVGQKVVKPGDVIQQKNGNMYIKKLKCRVCNYRAAWESEMTRHEQRVHGLDEKKSNQKPARPIPNLIPIQNKPGAQQGPPPPPPPPVLPLPRPPLPLMHQQSRAMMQQKQLMHQMPTHPHFQQNQQSMNRHPFLPQHMQHQFNMSMSATPQTHNLPPHYPQQLPSRFAQPKNVMPKMKSQYAMSNHHQKPAQSKPSPPPPPILKIPTPTKVRTPSSSPAISSPDKTMTEKDLNDICAKSCPTSSLKDFASLMGGDEAFKSEGEKLSPQKLSSNLVIEKSESLVSENQITEEGPKSPEAMKKKNSFFDELKAKFKTGESCNLLCNQCGHESKCLSESLRHQKIHRIQSIGNSSGSGTVFSNADLSSTRCQYCRQRCKTSSDLLVHLKTCPEANRVASDPLNIDDGDEEGEVGELGGEQMDVEDNEGEEEDKSEEGFEDPDGMNPHPMENKVFVWTNVANGEEDGLDDEYECGSQSPSSDCVFGIETAPGIGAVTSTNKAAAHGNTIGQAVQSKEVKPKVDNSVKKVYKCPHCSFWASTASRFHVHIVGHLNKKPFECSLCCYRSNWRWDITKHIRLKTVRDSTHQRAKVLMTDETGRRNYSKYNKYLTMMRVHEPLAESSGTGLRGKKLTQSFEPIETLPTPPKLTPAPHVDGNSSSPDSPNQMKNIYQKPPTLQSSLDMKRKGAEDSEDEPPKKKGTLENKKTMWKCKKCLFRDSDRAVVLAHVKGHYRNQGIQNNQSEAPDEASSKRLRLQDEVPQPYMCGHCHQVSQWKHVIQRHCRLKHNGDVKVNLAPRQHPEELNRNSEENEPESFMCETCPFVGSSQQGMDDHMEKHFERPGANFKCYFCTFFVYDKEELVEHISLHGEPEVDENYSAKEEDPAYTYSSEGENGEPFMNKRYRCTVCPYVSNSKTQFLYHKQFHRPRGAPFQCSLCSYNVPRRHFLQQHLRLHGINTPLPRRKGLEQVDIEAPLNIKDIDTSNMAEIPLVWVSKLGSLTKMFKCRYCPHVNIRKSNIQEHEKMHGVRTKPNPEGSSPIPQQQHHCPECNYICNNAGVLSSHAKVHQGLFGQVCGLVDLSRSDDEQIKELNDLLGRDEEGPPEITPDEVFKDFKDASPQLQSSPDKDGQIDNRVMHFCQICPARFLYPKELEIHLRFHNLQLQFQCDSCSYTARQQPHLLAHYKVHTDEYQDRTTALCEVYQISEEHPKPKIAVIVDGSEEVGPAWVVVERQKLPAKDPQNEYDLDEAPSDVSQHGSRIVTKQFSCDNCPAKFFKSVALQYHLTLHGSTNPHKCRVCDYAVKTYGNLIKHETVHEDLEPRVKLKNKTKRSLDYIPTSGTELFKQKTEANQKVAAAPPPPPPLHIDPEFGILMHGSPEFVYPTYLKNGRLKEKRYKCHKCPSAFEKREQYKVHLSLHGSKQRYNCERCDYSVKYYANYIQHLRKHQSNDVTRAERKSSTEKNTDDLTNDDGSEIATETTIVDEFQPQPPLSSRASKKMKLSMADQQTTMLMQQRVISSSVSAPEVTNRCPNCPYSNQRKEGVGSHVKCHSNVKGGAFACKYCDYTVPQQHFLREHNKLHFSPVKSNRPEAYMKCDRLELWAEPVQQNTDEKNGEEKANKVLIFKDLGTNFKKNRFLPAFDLDIINSEGEHHEKLYINLKTGEIDATPESIENSDKEDEKENVNVVRNDKIPKDMKSCSLEKEDSKSNKIVKTEVGSEISSIAKENYMDCENANLTIETEAEDGNTSMVIDDDTLEDNTDSKLNETDHSEDQILPGEYNTGDTKNLLVETDKHQQRTETELIYLQNGEDEAFSVKTEVCDSTTDNRLGLDSFNIILGDQEPQELQINNETNNTNESHSNIGEETNANESQDGSVEQESNGECGDKSETKDSSSGSSDSDTEDSSSDSSSSSDDSDDSTSSSAESSQPL